MCPKVELLEHHRQIGANADDLGAIRRAAVQTSALPDHRFAAKQNVALLAIFQKVRAAQ